jgi:hypothetical protein
MDRRDFTARLDRLTAHLPATAPDGPTLGDLLDRIRDREYRELVEQRLTVLLDSTASDSARADAAELIYRSGFFDG